MRVGSARSSLVALSLALCCAVLISPAAAAEPTSARPNMLFIIMDDVGIDQLSTLG